MEEMRGDAVKSLSPRFFDRPAYLYLRPASWPPNACPTKGGKIGTTARGSRPPPDLYLFPVRIYISRCLYRDSHLDVFVVVCWWHGRFVKLSNVDNRLDWNGTVWIKCENPRVKYYTIRHPIFFYIHLTCYKITRCALLIIKYYRYSSHIGRHDTARKVIW